MTATASSSSPRSTEHLDWERYWESPEMVDFRVRHSSWYQVPVLYGWWDRTTQGVVTKGALAAGNGQGNGAPIVDLT